MNMNLAPRAFFIINTVPMVRGPVMVGGVSFSVRVRKGTTICQTAFVPKSAAYC